MSTGEKGLVKEIEETSDWETWGEVELCEAGRRGRPAGRGLGAVCRQDRESLTARSVGRPVQSNDQ